MGMSEHSKEEKVIGTAESIITDEQWECLNTQKRKR